MFLVTGATGNVGAELVRALAHAGEKVRALTRSGRPPVLPSGVEAGRAPRTFEQWATAHADAFR